MNLGKANETALVKQLLDYLKLIGIQAWRANTGAMKREGVNGKSRWVRFGVVGQSDILAVVPPLGRFLAIETKTGANCLTPNQDAFLNNVREAGGIGVCVRSLAGLQAALRAEGVRAP